MATVREVITRIGFKVDKKGLKQAENGIQRINKKLNQLRTFLVGGLVVRGITSFFRLGSDVVETLNVLDIAFEEQSKSVQAWASNVAQSVGRSEFQLRDFASRFGSFLKPIVKSNKLTAEMSTNLTQVAVDIGSLFNKPDEQALEALRSAMLGLVKPLRGITGASVMAGNVAQFVLAKGITKSMAAMTEAERLMHRYEFILERVSIAQGDAVRTIRDYANATKKLRGILVDMATRMSLFVLPTATKMVNATIDGVNATDRWNKALGFLKPALIAIGLTLTGIALPAIKKFLLFMFPLLPMFFKVAAGLTVISFAVEDLFLFLTGGKSLIGDIIDALFGIGAAKTALDGVLFVVDRIVLGLKIMLLQWKSFGKIALFRKLGKFLAPEIQMAKGTPLEEAVLAGTRPESLLNPALANQISNRTQTNRSSKVTNNITINGNNPVQMEQTLRRVFRQEFDNEMSISLDSSLQGAE